MLASSAPAGTPTDDVASDALDREFRRLVRVLAGEPAPASPPRAELPAAVRRLAGLFDLSPFEVDVLLLAAGAELDPRVRHAIRACVGGEMPTIGLACTRLSDARWDALAPAQPLRRWALIHTALRRPIVDSEFGVDETILALMLGSPAPDVELDGWIRRPDSFRAASAGGRRDALTRAALDRATRALTEGRPVVLSGDDAGRRADAVTQVSRELGLEGAVLELSPAILQQRDARLPVERRVARSALLEAALVSVEVEAVDAGVRELAARFSSVGVPLIVSTADRERAPGEPAIGAYDGFELIRVGARRRSAALASASDLVDTVLPVAGLDDLVLPDEQHEAIRDFVALARQREALAQAWGGALGHGASAMFSGESGTGKTLAAEAIASALGVALHIVDFSAVVSKWVGDTPKNVSALFEECADGVLLFDEADALFGHRGEVEKGTDRYANLEVSHLLTRLERHRGVTVLTTNLAPAIDTAFHRRLDAIVEFPMPDADARAILWERAFPPAVPVDEIDLVHLSGIPVTGATIRGIARRAAALAGSRGVPVDTATVLEAARKEYRKLGRRPRAGELAMT